MKICVYAISKNESKFVDRWYESMKEADEIYVLDTGSTDDTVEKLKKHNIKVTTKIIAPWRFDVARNESLKLVPEDADLCVCTDLDEIFDKGWRQKLEQAQKYNLVKYNYIWSFDKNNNPAVNFFYEKIHSRHGYKWVNPVHEVLECSLKNPKTILIEDIVLKHYPDSTKSRSSYLPLLELSVKENPKNDRNYHYLGREYKFYGKYKEAIKTLKHHLKMKNATWRDERCASMRFISRSYYNLKDYKEALRYAIMSISEAPYLREGYYETGLIYYHLNEYYKAKLYLLLALQIKSNPKTYINDPACYNGTIEDLLTICEYNLKNYKEAYIYVNKALKYNPNEPRLLRNKEIIEKLI